MPESQATVLGSIAAAFFGTVESEGRQMSNALLTEDKKYPSLTKLSLLLVCIHSKQISIEVFPKRI
jgi:hypothetical protein